MKPSRFAYHRPATLDEALATLERYEGEAKILAGGQSLVPIMNMRLARPAALVDINRLPDLAGIAVDGDRLRVGALARHRAVERSPLVAEHCPVLADAMHYVGHIAIRNRGTAGGSLAHADPAAELPAVAAALDATFEVRGPGGNRTVPWDEFFVSYLTTALEPNEVLCAVTLRTTSVSTGWSFHEIARRHGDFALAGVVALVELDPQGRYRDARVALIGVGATPVRSPAIERQLIGSVPSSDVHRAAAAALGAQLEPNGDVHATADYRREIAIVLVERALDEAAARARLIARAQELLDQ